MNKCESFCKNDYAVKMQKVYERIHKKYNIPPKRHTNKKRNFKLCKKTYCNKTCSGFDEGDILFFDPKIRNGFETRYSKKMIKKLKHRGALSACIYNTDYH